MGMENKQNSLNVFFLALCDLRDKAVGLWGQKSIFTFMLVWFFCTNNVVSINAWSTFIKEQWVLNYKYLNTTSAVRLKEIN